jgi:hypothetical protein
MEVAESSVISHYKDHRGAGDKVQHFLNLGIRWQLMHSVMLQLIDLQVAGWMGLEEILACLKNQTQIHFTDSVIQPHLIQEIHL